MSAPTTERQPTDTQQVTTYDAIVIGAGFGGIYQLKRLRDDLGLHCLLLEKGEGVGGTWFWNRYPGAMSDTESFVYRYSFDKELLQEWDYDTSYLHQPKVLKYLEAVVDKHDLARDMRLGTEVTEMTYDEDSQTWTVTAADGTAYTGRFLVTGLGLLSATNVPDFPGIDDFQGEKYHTGAFPSGVTYEGKRVGVIGTGSTGVQVITAIAPEVEHLTVFQRSAQYSVPSGFKPVDGEYLDEVRSRYDEIWSQVKDSICGFGFVESETPAMSVSAQERQRVFQENWDKGNGFRFMFGTFSDIAADPEANEAACEFIRGKIAEIVKDPEKARKLTPTEPYAKRPLCDAGYYERYNQDNVDIVSLPETPIETFTEKGIRTADGIEHELDMVIFATGFDAVDGNYMRMKIKGRDGETIQQHWSDGPTSYLGMTIPNFPNLFMILGPNGPFANLPPAIEVQVDWITDAIAQTLRQGGTTFEADAQAEADWTVTCKEIADTTLFPKTDSWIFGANIPGKKNTVMFYMGGLGAYGQILRDVEANDFEGFTIT